jgi:TolA-binding protein
MKNIIKPIATAVLLAALVFSAPRAFAVNKDLIQLQTQVQALQDAVARLQQTNDENMGVLKSLVQQSADSVNKMSVAIETMQRQSQAQQEAQGGKIDGISGQVQSLNDSLDELKARLAKLEKLTTDIQTSQQSMSANMQNQAPASAPADGVTAPPQSSLPPASVVPDTPAGPPAPAVRKGKGKPSADVAADPGLPPTAPTTSASDARPVDELYQTALGDYMAAKYALSSSEFGDVVKAYPDNQLAGNAYYYMAEIDYRGGRYPSAIKNYDKVIEQFPGNAKIPVSHLHKGQALVAQKQTDAGVREYRALIQRFPNSQEASLARSRLNGMGVPIVPRTKP